MADQFAPDQVPAQEPVTVDPPAKRAKFLSKFAALDPEADLNEESLGGILTDPEKRDEFTKYVNQLNPDFTMNGQELADALGYGADVKKKPGGSDSSTGLLPAQTSPANGLAEGDIEFRQMPQAGPLGYALPGDPSAPKTLAPDFVGPAEAGTYQRPSDTGTAAEGTQYVDAPSAPAPVAEAADVADDGFWASLGKSLYNGLDAKRIGGNLLDYGGDLIELLANNTAYDDDGTPLTPIAELGKPLTSYKYSDVKGAELLAAAQASDLPLSEAARASVLSNPSLAAAGNLLGSGVASIVPVAAASALGGPLAGAGMGGALGISGTKDAARAAGISDDEATVTATVLAPIQAALEAVGVQDAGLSKLAVRATLREAVAAGGGKLTAQALAAAAKQVIPEIGRRAAGGAGREALTEFLQGVAEGEGQVLADTLRDNPDATAGQGRYGTTQADVLKSAAEQAVVGGVLGGGLGTLHGTPTTQRQAAPTADTTYYITGDSSTTDEGALPEARVVGPGTKPGTVRIEGITFEGEPVQREVAQIRLLENKPGEGFDAALVTREPTAQEDPTPAAEEPLPAPAEEAPAPIDEPAQVAPTPTSTPEPEPSAIEAAATPASPPDAVGGPVSAADEAATTPSAEPLPEAAPDPTQVKVLTPQQQATNNTLDAFDRYNALKPGQQKGKEGSAARAEIARAAKKAGIDVTVDKAGKVTLAGGKRLTRSNEYTATTPAANHVPLDQRPEDAHAFMEALLFTGDQNNPSELQGLGIKIRGKELSGRELSDAVKDIRAGRNTLRAQLVLDALENAHRKGYVEKSTGTGLATRKFQVPIEDYMGQPDAMESGERELTDQEWDDALSADPNLAEAVASYTDPTTGEIDYTRLAADSERGALETFFDVPTDVATKITALANERAQQTQPVGPPDQIQRGPVAADEATALTGSTAEGSAQPSEPATPSQGPAPASTEIAPASTSENVPVQPVNADLAADNTKNNPISAPATLAEQNVSAKAEFAEGLAAFRAARKKGGGVLQSSVLGVPAFSAEEAAALTKMAKAAIKLGAVKTKQVIARLRAQGLTDDDVTDDQLRPFVKQLLKDEGVRQPKAPRDVPQNPTDPTNTKQRQGAQSVADSGLSDELSQGLINRGTNVYTPKPLAETKAHVDRIIAAEGIDKAYYTASHDSVKVPRDVQEVLRIQVMAHYDADVRRLRADPTANAATIDEAVERAGRIADVYVTGGTEAGRALRARQVLDQYAPSVAVARLAREVKETGDKQRAAAAPAARRRAKAVRQEKGQALDAALAAPAVQAVLGQDPAPAAARNKVAADPAGWGSKNKYFTKETAMKAREALRKLGLSTVVPPELIQFLGFHIEAGARSFADVSARAVRDLGQRVRPLLPEAYEEAKKEFVRRGGDNKGFDGPDAVEAALRSELAEDLAERIVLAVKPSTPEVFNPVRDMLNTLTKKVREKLPANDKTPRAARELLALAINDRREYSKVIEESKQEVLKTIAKLKVDEAVKQKMVDDVTNFTEEATGNIYAQQQFLRAVRQAEDVALAGVNGKSRGEKLNNLAKYSDLAYLRVVKEIQDHVTAEVRATDTEAGELRDAVAEEINQKMLARRRALRAQQGVYEPGEQPAPTTPQPRPTLSARVADLLALRATNEQVANRLTPDAVREGLAAEGQRIQQIARDHLNDPTDVGRSLADAFVRDAGIAPAQARVYADAIEREFNAQIAKARDKAVQQAYSRKVRTSEPKAAQDLTDRVRKLYTLSPTDEGRVLGLVADEAGLPELTKADNTKLYQLAQAIADAKGDNAKARAVQQFYLGVKGIRGLTGWEQVKTVMYANMLSGLGTQLKNINSTGLNTASDLFYATGWAGFLAVKQAARTGSLSALKLATAPLRGILNRSGADRAYQMLKTGVRPPGYEGKFDEASDLEVMAMLPATSALGVVRKAYASMAKYVPRLLSANDLMWSGGAEQMWAYNMALTDAIAEGRNLPTDQIWASVNERLYGTSTRLVDAQAQATQEMGPAPAKNASLYNSQYRLRVQELMEASRDQRLATESKRAAAETTFNGPMEGFLGDVMSKLGRLTEAEAGRGTQPLKGIVPFTRIVANVTNAFLNYTPVGGLRAAKGQIGWGENGFAREYTPMERSIVAAKSVTGVFVMAAAYAIFDDDDELTGNGPSDPAQNRAWQQRGHKPYTIGGVNYKDSPWYYPLASVAALKEAQAYDGADFDNDPVFAARAARMVVATTQASFASLSLTNLQDFLNALSDPSKGKDPAERMVRYVQRTGGAVASSVLLPGSGFLRGLSRTGQQLAGSTKREGQDVWGMMGQDIPGLRNELPRVYDVLGNEVSVGSNVPFMPVPETQDETGATKRINEFLDKNRLFIPDINRYQSDMQVLKGRVGELSGAEQAKMKTMTDTERKRYLLSRLGGEGPMPADKWQEFYPKRGRLIKEKLLLHLPELEALAKNNPRLLRKRLNKYYRKATKAAKKGIDFSDPDVKPVQED